ncbi:MAG: hypothetical protein PVH37_22960 [Desulfobacterales bacterium]|jgi:hypothetical protein
MRPETSNGEGGPVFVLPSFLVPLDKVERRAELTLRDRLSGEKINVSEAKA